MFSKRQARIYCCEPVENIENYSIAQVSNELYAIHHRLEDMGLARKDLIALNRYYHRPACELIFILNSAHNQLHSKRIFSNDDYKRRASIRMKEKLSNPSNRELWKENSRNSWKIKDVREKRTKAIKASLNAADMHIKLSKAHKKVYDDPAIRDKVSQAQQKRWADAEARLQQSEKLKQVFSNPNMRSKLSERTKAGLADPEIRRKRTEASKRALSIIREEYAQYKANGGILMWNDYRKNRNLHKI